MSKNIIHSKWLLVIVCMTTATIMLAYEAFKEFLFKGTLTPWQSHTITICVTSLIATLTASIIRSWVQTIIIKEKEVESKEQALASFGLILSAVNHIVNNVLNYLQLVKVEVELKGKLRKETVELLEKSLQEADQQMKLLNMIQEPHKPESYDGIYPGEQCSQCAHSLENKNMSH